MFLKERKAFLTILVLTFLLNIQEFKATILRKGDIDPNASISTSKENVCIGENLEVIFTGSDGNAPYTFIYSINNERELNVATNGSSSSISINVNTSITNSFIYKLISVKDNTGTITQINQDISITVNAPPTIDFSFNNDNTCSGTNISFTSTVSGNAPYTYFWDFGDENTSTLEKPIHQFEALGCGNTNFDVKLTVTDKNGCTSSVVTKTVRVIEKPDISLFDTSFGDFDNCNSASPSNPSYTVEVNNSSLDNCVTSLNIDWGDGSTTSNPTFPLSHTYSSIGLFKLEFTGVGSNGCSNTVSYDVKNVNNPAGGFESPGNTSNLCAPTEALGFGISNWGLNSSDTRYIVNFGDGSTQSYTQTELENSVYHNASDPGNSQTFPTPHSYTSGSCSVSGSEYIATLTVANACASTEFTISNISVLDASTPEFTVDASNCVNKSITFKNTSIIGNNPGCSSSGSFTWDFGDGTIVNRNNVSRASNESHTYSLPGNYDVTLTINSFCGSTTITKQICVEPETASNFSLSDNEGCIPFNITTTNETVETSLCSAPKYLWTINYTAENCGESESFSFVNGTDENSKNPEIIFNEPGNYELILNTITGCGTVTASEKITVTKPPEVTIEPIADFCGNASISPTANIENCTNNSGSLSYNWNFIGASQTNSTILNPENIGYTVPGTYTVSLEVTNECGISTTATTSFEVFEKPVITNSNLTQEICSGQNTTQIDFVTSDNTTTYSWVATASSGISGFTASGNSDNIPSERIINNNNTTGTVTYTVIPNLNGCEGESINFVITVNPAPLITQQPISSEICIGGVPNELEVQFINGLGTPNYQWFQNSTNSNTGGTAIAGATDSKYTPVNSPAGITYYYVEISFSSGGCSKIVSDIASVDIKELIVINSTPQKEFVCIDGSASPFSVSFTGGTSSITYQWFQNTSNSNTGGTLISGANQSTYTPPTYTNIGNFFYYVEVSSTANGCSLSTSNVYEVEVVDDPVITSQSIEFQELCQTSAVNTLELLVSGGTNSNYSYQWFSNTVNDNTNGIMITGETTNSYTPPSNLSGTFYYYCKISQPESGCSVVSNISTLIINPAPTITSQPLSSEICLGDTPNVLEVDFTSGVGTVTYQWYENTIDSNTAGTLIDGATNREYTPSDTKIGTTYYYAEISFSSGGCSQIFSDVASVTINPNPEINDATLTIYSEETFTFSPETIAGNIVPVDTRYTWSIVGINPENTISGASSETTLQNTISQFLENLGTSPATITYNIKPETSKCSGDNFNLDVTVNPSLSPNAIIMDVICFGENNGSITTNIAGGVPFASGNPYLISWSGPDNYISSNTSISNLVPGIYTITVEDSQGFTSSESYEITEPDELEITTNLQKDVSCFEGNDGVINITITGGTAPFTYIWSTSDGQGLVAGLEDQNTLTKGTFNLEVIDINDCVISESFIIEEPSALAVNNISKQDILCFGENTGSISLDISGGTPAEISPGIFDYTYKWTGPNGYSSNEKNIDNLISGDYILDITDALGCTFQTSITLDQSTEIKIDVTKKNLTCNGANDGSIDVMISGGVLPYQISWSNFANGTSLNNLSAGIYTITIIDGNNCEKKLPIEVEAPLFSISPEINDISCNGSGDGSIKLNLKGGILPVSVLWDDNASAGVERNNLNAGTYTVSIIDSDVNQCPITRSFTITEPSAVTVNEVLTDAIDCNTISSGSIELEVFGGRAPYTFSWSNGATDKDLFDISSGTYGVTITDANDCLVEKVYTIFRQEPLQISLLKDTSINCVLKETIMEITASVSGGFPPYTYEWSSGEVSGTNGEKITVKQDGSYSVNIIDNKGCTKTETFNVDLPRVGTADFNANSFALQQYNVFSIKDPIQFTNNADGDFLSISWNFGDGSGNVIEENPNHTYDRVGTFLVTQQVTYENNCIDIFEKEITVDIGYSLIIPDAFTPNNDGINDTIRPNFTGMVEVEITILDSWGAVIFNEKGDRLKGWNGLLKTKPAENGNYIMMVRAVTFYATEITETKPIILLK